jgi:H+/Cl- antiporter ClcA
MLPIFKQMRLFRRSRVVLGSWQSWRPRIVFWLGAILIGQISVLFARFADEAQRLFKAIALSTGWHGYTPLLMTPAVFALCAYLTLKIFPNAQGSGIPQAIAARHLREDEQRSRLLSPKLALGKIVLTVAGLFGGASIGREGPTVQVGASIMLQAARWGGISHTPGLILAGSAAGIAAAFNTPLAGIVFAIEEMGRSYQSRTNGTVLTAVILSGLAAMALLGNYTYFGHSYAYLSGPKDWLVAIVCGVGGGLLGALFSRSALYMALHIKRWAMPNPVLRLVGLAAACGLASALVGIVSGGATYGTGYEQAKAALEGSAPSAVYFLEKLIAGFLAMISGIPGGIFAPSLSVGAGFGSTVGMLFGTSIGLAALLGMAGYFAGVVQAPMTAFVIILEMTDGQQNIIALMAVAMIGYVTSRVVSREPLYHGLSRNFVAQALRRQRAMAHADTVPR